LKRKETLLLLLLTFAALLVSGYHPWAEDAEIYLPGVEKLLHPELFPFNAQFFEDHASHTVFRYLIAESVRFTHLPLATVLFVLQLTSIFLLFLACWQLIGRCFPDRNARWAGVSLIAALLTLPIAGTALYILDQYLDPRNLAAFAMIFAIVSVLDRKFVRACVLLALAAVIHPLMAAFAILYCGLLIAVQNNGAYPATVAALVPFGLTLDPPNYAYDQVALHHPEHYITHWTWYELLGAIAPLFILGWMTRFARSRGMRNLELLCRTLVIYLLFCLPIALVFSIFPRFEALARLQPMRSLYLLYILMFLFGGGLLGQYVLKNRMWRWLVLFVPLCTGMFVAQRTLFPVSAHIEWPWSTPRNGWVQAFEWVQQNTPVNSVFALGTDYMELPSAEQQGFRAVAERSRLADERDAGAASMFPTLAEEWLRQSQAQRGWENFSRVDFERLHAQYGVTWVIIQASDPQDIECPYENDAVKVCRLDSAQSEPVRTAGATGTNVPSRMK
jgi:hypothetical protein